MTYFSKHLSVNMLVFFFIILTSVVIIGDSGALQHVHHKTETVCI
jgi:hypothetical protein